MNDPTLTAFFDEVRTAFTAAPSAEVKAAHMAARLQAPSAPGLKRRRVRRRAVRGFVIGVALVSAGGSALAATGELPAPAQRALAHAADHVGVHLPRVEAKPALTKGVHRQVRKATVVVRTSTPSDTTVSSSGGSSQTTHVRSSSGSTTTSGGSSTSVTTGQQHTSTDQHSSSGQSASSD